MNKIITNSVVKLLIFLFFISCKENINEVKKDKEENVIQIDSFEYKLKNKPKIFLDFWDEMSFEDFSKVKTLLIKEDKLIEDGTTEYYNLGEMKIKIEPYSIPKRPIDIFELNNDCEFYKNSEKYNGILLRYIDTASYKVFQTKYNLNKLEKIRRYVAMSAENNQNNFLTSDLKILKIFDNETTNKILDNYLTEYYSINYPMESSERFNYINKKEQIIENNGNVIIFKTIGNSCRDKQIELFDKESYTSLENAKKEAKTKIVLFENNKENVILYTSKRSYDKYLKSVNDEDFRIKKIKQKKIQTTEKRKTEAINEI